MAKFDLRVKVTTWVTVEGETEQDAISNLNNKGKSEIFPDDIMTDDIIALEYDNKCYLNDED